MFLVKKNWQIPVRSLPSEEVEQVEESAARAFHSVFGSRPGHTARVPLSHDLKERWRKQATTQTDYEAYIVDFLTEGVAFVPDDKNKKWAWAINPSTYVLLLYTFVLLSTSWALTSFSVDFANSWLVSMIGRILGQQLARRLGVDHRSSFLPYCYVTLKSKCWQGPVRVRKSWS